MSSLITPSSVSRNINHFLHLQKKIDSLPPLSVGEIVEAEIVERQGERTFLISFKNRSISADSEIPLRIGEKRSLRVEQLSPRVILRVLQNEKSESVKFKDFVKYINTNPKALLDMFVEGRGRFSPENLAELTTLLGKEDIETLQKLIQTMTMSKGSLNDGFFKNYIYNLGYLMEKELAEALEKKFGRANNVARASDNIKGILTKISDKVKMLSMNAGHPGAERLSQFINSSLKTIEAHQVVNVLLRESENEYMFQIPVLFPEQLGLAEIYVKFDNTDSNRGERKKQQRVLFLLNMDALGDIVVEATIDMNKMGCVVRCSREEIRAFVVPFLQELEEKLVALGYDVDHLTCVTETDISMIKKIEHERVDTLYDREGVDVVV
ncbi:MAG: hypothetical protein JXC33_08240 [Deltaproteobacteria bacterium]|nr:hypothetical protein [Deltaproteobacteria bacterium]